MPFGETYKYVFPIAGRVEHIYLKKEQGRDMKKILAYLMSLFMAITNNIEFNMPGDLQYSRGSYYTIEEGKAPNYQDLFGSNPVAAKQTSCQPSTFKGSGKFVSYSDKAQHVQGVWVVNREDMRYDELPDGDSYQFESSGYIIMPYTGILKTSSKTSTGHSMVLIMDVGNTEYRMTVNNMERWWCCLGKLEPDTTDMIGQEIWVHTCDELQGTQMRQGYVLGNAQEGTTVAISKSDGSKVTWKDFYGH